MSEGANVRFGPLADICAAIGHVRLLPKATLDAYFGTSAEAKADMGFA
jgi:hypothetical protein